MNAHPEDILAPKSAFNIADGDGFMLHGSQYKTNRYRQGSEGLPGFEVMACIKRNTLELGRPCNLLMVFVWYTVIEAHKGKPGNRPIPQPKQA
jgi:hypothetical protein